MKTEILYHGTTAAAAEDIRKNGFNLDKGRFGRHAGIHFMKDQRYTKAYNKGGLIKAYANLKKPMDFAENFAMRAKIIKKLTGKKIKDMSRLDWQLYTGEIDRIFRETAEKKGYDGIYDKHQPEVVVFDPSTIEVIE